MLLLSIATDVLLVIGAVTLICIGLAGLYAAYEFSRLGLYALAQRWPHS